MVSTILPYPCILFQNKSIFLFELEKNYKDLKSPQTCEEK